MLAGVILSQKLTKAVILIMPWGSDQPWDTLRYQVMMLIHSLRNTAASSHHTLNETLAIQSCSGNLTPRVSLRSHGKEIIVTLLNNKIFQKQD